MSVLRFCSIHLMSALSTALRNTPSYQEFSQDAKTGARKGAQVAQAVGGWLLLLLICLGSQVSAADNVVFVTWDGFRWQELFHGADARLINKPDGGVPDADDIRARFWRETPEARRQTLLPFFWSTVARQGQVFGDPAQQSAARITNRMKFSYPGYNEMLVGFADDRIDSNNKIPNPNVNVLEFLHGRPGFSNRVAAFATWDVMEYILNRPRSGFLVQSGWTLLADEPLSPQQQEVNVLVNELPRLWRNNAYDFLTHRAALEYVRKHRPRVLYVGLGETDEWAHARRYDLYLEAAQRSDRYLRELWELLQSLPQYRDRTALVLTTDHGRGITPRDWTSHGADVPEAEYIWIAALG
ncbi:MAG: alkaline phosphatase family protein, partial [Pirellulaceae bacterium]